MYILEHYYEYIIKQDLLNKFNYLNVKNVPNLKKIILNFGCSNHRIKNIAPAVLMLELLSNKLSKLTKTKKSNVLLKIKRGTPVGCCLVLKKTKMYIFLFKLLIDILPELKNFKGAPITSNEKNCNSFSLYIKDLALLKEFSMHFHFFSKLPPLSITLVTNAKTKTELKYLLLAFKIPNRM